MKIVRKNQKGFTLIELLVVIIIVAVLAGVGIPLMSGNIDRARLSEGVAGLGTIRTGLRAVFAENAGLPAAQPTFADLGINNNDLLGRYFANNDYTIQDYNADANTYCIAVTGNAASAAPAGNEVAGISRSMNQDGTVFNNANCGAGG